MLECHHPECMSVSTPGSPQRCRKRPTISSPPQQAALLQPVQPSPPSTARPRDRERRLLCEHCNAVPEGFRSEHELRRHTNREHKKVRKVWITVDASDDSQFLRNCKACESGKMYNECYNAASHLRRMHFHPRKRGEGKQEQQLRGGKRGSGTVRSEQPTMDELKARWLKEIVVEVGEGESAPKDDLESSEEGDSPINSKYSPGEQQDVTMTDA